MGPRLIRSGLARPFGRVGRHAFFHSKQQPAVALSVEHGVVDNRNVEAFKLAFAPTPTPSLARRQLATPGVTVVVESVVDVIVPGDATPVAEFTIGALPTTPVVVSVHGAGPLTISPPSTPISAPATGVAVPSPSISTPKPTVSVATLTVDNFNIGRSSQVVLSSPPSTPLPIPSSMSLPTVTGSGLTTSAIIVSTLAPSANFSSTAIPATTAAPTLRTGFLSLNGTQGVAKATAGTGDFASTAGLSDLSSATGIYSGTASGGIYATGSPSAAVGGSDPGSNSDGGGSATATQSSAAAAALPPVQTPVVVGGVVGGLAGLTIFLVLILFLLRWRRTKLIQSGRLIVDAETAPPSTAQSNAAMAPANFQPFFKRLRPYSGQTTATTDTSTSTERGFQKVSGRKIGSVLLNGGDGYGGPGPNTSNNPFYRRSNQTLNESLHVGPGSPPLSPAYSTHTGTVDRGRATPPASSGYPPGLPIGPERDGGFDKEVVFMRPGPARSITTSPGGIPYPDMRMTPPPLSASRPEPLFYNRPDALGRSHASRDGSRGSKFAEDLG